MSGQVLEALIDHACERHQPLEVLVEITHRCNLPCKHCYLPDHDDHGELSLQELCNLFDQLAEMGTLFLSITGGEVCSRKDFPEILDAAAARGFVIKVLTNATMITDELAQRMADAGVIEVSVSVYGATAEIHDAVTDLPGSFVRTMAGIARVRAHGIQVVMKTPLMTDNGRGAHHMHQMARMMAMPCMFDMTITPKNDGNMSPLELSLQRPAMIELMKGTDELAQLLAPPPSDFGPGPCQAGRSHAGVSPTGDVVACIMMPVPVGNIRQRPFHDIWFGSPFLDEVRAVTRESLTTCHSCDVKGACDRCTGMAVMRGLGVNGCDLTAKPVASARIAAHRLRVIQ